MRKDEWKKDVDRLKEQVILRLPEIMVGLSWMAIAGSVVIKNATSKSAMLLAKKELLTDALKDNKLVLPNSDGSYWIATKIG